MDSIKTLHCDSLLAGARMHGLVLPDLGRFHPLDEIPNLRACPNVETNTEGFPYSGNYSMLCGVDVYLRSQV